jgi:fructokinase
MRLVSFGEVLWDVLPNCHHLGGAAFNLAAHVKRFGHQVSFISAVGDDELGARALRRIEDLGVSTDYVLLTNSTPTGTVHVTVTGGQPSYVIHRPAAYDCLRAPETPLDPDWICFGTLVSMNKHARAELTKLIATNPGARRFYDVNLRHDSWTPELVAELIAVADVVKLNEEEARLIDTVNVPNVCITRGAGGCTVRYESKEVNVPGRPVDVVDAVGAGDAWSAAFLHGLSSGWPLERTAQLANNLGGLVASREGAIPEWTLSEILP